MENIIHISDIDDELYGALLSANEKIDEAGANLVIASIVIGLLISLVIHMSWIDQLVNFSLEDVRNWYSYLIITVLCFLTSCILCSRLENHAYISYRQDILDLAERVDLNKYKLVASIEGDEALKKVSECIKKDTSLGLLRKHEI